MEDIIKKLNDENLSFDISDSKKNLILDGSLHNPAFINVANIAIVLVSCLDNPNYEGNIYIYTGTTEFIWIRNRKKYKLLVDNKIGEYHLGKIVNINDITDIQITFNTNQDKIIRYPVVYARCNNSMKLLDKIYRNYLMNHKFNTNGIVSINAVAGAGKTTTLLKLSIKHKEKSIIYLAFNRSLVEEIKNKLFLSDIDNLSPFTFDSLIRNIYYIKHRCNPNLVELKPNNISKYIPWLNGKPYKVKEYYQKAFTQFCNQSEFRDMESYCINRFHSPKPILNQIWSLVMNGTFHTFDSLRKMAQVEHWCRDYIDSNYQLIFIDECQDFDPIMLDILLTDTNIPKLFVGDNHQSIYQWRGCINTFSKLPKNSLNIEFYSSYRLGHEACKKINEVHSSIRMISKSKSKTYIREMEIPKEKYVYLFRTWKNLLKEAQVIDNIWISNYSKQVKFIRNLYQRVSNSYFKLSKDELSEYSDDLPAFLLSLSKWELNNLLTRIEQNLVEKDKAICEMHTIHNFKGMEADNIRIYDDIDLPEEINLYYVALTRAKKNIYVNKLKICSKSIPIPNLNKLVKNDANNNELSWNMVDKMVSDFKKNRKLY